MPERVFGCCCSIEDELLRSLITTRTVPRGAITRYDCRHKPQVGTDLGRGVQSASVWRERRKSRAGTTFALWLNEQATVGFNFLRHINGRMVGRRCLVRTPRNAGYRACSRAVITGALSFPGHRGMNTVGFQGLVSHSKKLEPGRYTLVITATNAAGQSSSPKSLNFTIV
jgi:hypothetical protein